MPQTTYLKPLALMISSIRGTILCVHFIFTIVALD